MFYLKAAHTAVCNYTCLITAHFSHMQNTILKTYRKEYQAKVVQKILLEEQ